MRDYAHRPVCPVGGRPCCVAGADHGAKHDRQRHWHVSRRCDDPLATDAGVAFYAHGAVAAAPVLRAAVASVIHAGAFHEPTKLGSRGLSEAAISPAAKPGVRLATYAIARRAALDGRLG